MTKTKGLSLCIIVKNDEKYLPHCLKNMKDIVDEIMIVNIGSKDLTMVREEQSNVTIYQMKEESSHSEVKNFCLDQAKEGWILFLQVNEIIPEEQGKRIHLLLDNPNAEGYLFYIDHSSQKHRISSPVASLRLIRNRKKYRYQHKIFERIPDEVLSNIKNADIRILQQGEVNSSDRSLLALEKELQSYPEDSYLQYMYGIELLNQQRHQESIGYFQKACKSVNLDYLFAPHLYKCLSWALIFLKRDKEALEVLEEGIKVFPFYTDLLVLRGELQRKFQQYTEVIRDLKRSLKIRERPNTMIPKPETNSSTILQILAEVHEEVFNYQEATICYQQAYQLNKSNQKPLYKIGELVKKLGSKEVLENLREVIGMETQLLLPLLSQESKEGQYMKLAEAWVEEKQQEAIEKIFLSITSKQKQLVLKQKIIEQLLRSGEIEAAEKFAQLGEPQSLGPLEYVLWSRSFTKKLRGWIQSWSISPDAPEILALQTSTKASKDLAAFYHSLVKISESKDALPLTEITSAKIHREIGDFYVKTKKRKEALSAYLRVLQWNPMDEEVQKKLRSVFHENPNEFLVFLREGAWVLEGSWFEDKQGFVDYTEGLIDFKNHQFEKAMTSFLKIVRKENSHPIAFAYIISSLWLMGKETEAKNWLKKVSKKDEIPSLLFCICKSYALDRLNEGHQQYPYSQLILLEKEKLCNNNE